MVGHTKGIKGATIIALFLFVSDPNPSVKRIST